MPDTEGGNGLDPRVIELARGKNFAALTTMLPNQHPQTQVMWVDADEEHVLINTEVHRQKHKNVERDPKVTVMIWDHDDPYTFAEVRGSVVDTVRGPEAREHIDKLSQKYHGKPYGTEIQSERTILKISPRRQIVRGSN